MSWRYWLLIANLRRYQLCLDAPLPHPVDSGALFHISRTGITAHSIAPGGRQLVRHRYALDLTRCPWVGVQKGI